MPQSRRLTLRREALTELSSDELSAVNGAAPTITTCALEYSVVLCYTRGTTCAC